MNTCPCGTPVTDGDECSVCACRRIRRADLDTARMQERQAQAHDFGADDADRMRGYDREHGARGMRDHERVRP